MNGLLKILPVVLALAVAPAFAAPADQHAAHHPAAKSAPKAAPGAKADDMQGCPMMGGKMAAGQMMDQQGGPGAAQGGKMAQGGMMSQGGAGGQGQAHCTEQMRQMMQQSHGMPAPGANPPAADGAKPD